MINFFPARYDDELLYSVLSRYRYMSGFISKQAFLKSLYNKKSIYTSIFFPQNLETLISNLPITSHLTPQQLVTENTLFSYYTTFMNQEKTEKIYTAMVGKTGISVESTIGLQQWNPHRSHYLKYCPTCIRNDIGQYGESYWKRIHQLPGILICPEHKQALEKSSIWANNMRLEYECADFSTCPKKETTSYNTEILKLNEILIRNSIKILNQSYKRREPRFFTAYYINKLREKGLASKRGSIYMQDFLREFIHFYKDDYLKLMNSEVVIDNENTWLRKFIRNTNKNRSPLKHLLLIQFLGIDIEEMFNTSKIIGKIYIQKTHVPKFNLQERREQWLKIVEANPTLNRSELKELGKGLHTWIFRYDREWYDLVTPRYKHKTIHKEQVDFKQLDIEMLKLAQKGVHNILKSEKMPKQLTFLGIKRVSGIKYNLKNGKFPYTYRYIMSVIEDTGTYRIRKIKWAIEELLKEGITPTGYKVQLKAGFGGCANKSEQRQLIEKILEDY